MYLNCISLKGKPFSSIYNVFCLINMIKIPTWYWDWTLPRIRAQVELTSTFVLWRHWTRVAVLRRIRTSPRPNYIIVQNNIIAKMLPVNKFTTLEFLSLLPSMNGEFFSWLLCNTCLYTDRFADMGIIVICPPRPEVRIPRRAATSAHFLVINKGAGQFYLSFDTR